MLFSDYSTSAIVCCNSFMDSCYDWWNYEGYVIVNLRGIDIESNILQLFRICYFVY